jgi:hypothetical protein
MNQPPCNHKIHKDFQSSEESSSLWYNLAQVKTGSHPLVRNSQYNILPYLMRKTLNLRVQIHYVLSVSSR